MSDPFLNPPKPPPPEEDRWICGLDLGQAMDFTALVVLQRTIKQDEREYNCPSIKRWPLATTYPAIVADLQTMLAKLPQKPTLVVDGTGCGRPVVDLIRKARLPIRSLVPIIITSGTTAGQANGYTTAPKRDLVGAVMSVMHKGRLHVARELPEAAALVKELRAFTARITTHGNEQYGNDWRVSPHDDLLLALALAIWQDRQLRRLTADSFFM
jgi:hypothetical protein